MKTTLLLLLILLFSVNAFSAVKTWDGGGADANWTTAANWANDVAPIAGDDLIFPLNAAQFTANNNFFFQTSFRSITITGGNYTIGGNPFRLTGGLIVKDGTQAINTAITLSAAQSFIAEQRTASVAIAAVRLGGFTLTIGDNGFFGIGVLSDAGTFLKTGAGSISIFSGSDFSGSFTINGGLLTVDATVPNSPVTVNAPVVIGTDFAQFSGLGGTGTVGATNVIEGIISVGSFTNPSGILTVQGNLTVSANGYVFIKFGSRTSNTVADQIKVNGTVNLSNAIFAPVFALDNPPPVGASFLVINNDGTDAVNGTFAAFPEGATVVVGLGLAFRVTYRGGDGNDVVFTRVRNGKFDFDGDGKSDVSVFRPSNGTWYQNLSNNGSVAARQFGASGDKIAPADFDGDNRTDLAVFRPSNGTWYQLRSADNTFTSVQFGTSEDIPVPNNYDGDGRADLAVFRPSNGTWYEMRTIGDQFFAQQFGQNGDQPQVGDFDGDGIGDLAVFRGGNWFLSESGSRTPRTVQFGNATDKPVPADYDGDGKTDVAVFRPSNGTWYQLNSGSNNSFSAVQFGTSDDVPVPADFDGDGKSDVAVFRPSNGVWYLNRSSSGFTGIQFGQSGDKPIPAAFLQ